MTSAFQVTFVGSVLFGLLSMLLLDTSTPTKGRADPRARDALGSLSLLGALMCSTVGDAMVAGTALFLFAKGPWRRALTILAGCSSFRGKPSRGGWDHVLAVAGVVDSLAFA